MRALTVVDCIEGACELPLSCLENSVSKYFKPAANIMLIWLDRQNETEWFGFQLCAVIQVSSQYEIFGG
jgi:hypothetical protein